MVAYCRTNCHRQGRILTKLHLFMTVADKNNRITLNNYLSTKPTNATCKHRPESPHCVVQIFCAPSFDDKILEVVAVFGSMQMAVSRVIKLQHHRIAQVRTHTRTIWKKNRHIKEYVPLMQASLLKSVSNSKDYHPGWWGGSHSGGRRGLDPAARSHQDPAQEPSSDAHQGPGE